MLEHGACSLTMAFALQVVAHHGQRERVGIDIDVVMVVGLAVDKGIACPMLIGAQRLGIDTLNYAQRLLGALNHKLLCTTYLLKSIAT